MRRINISEVLDYFYCPAYWASRWWAHKRLIGKREHAADVGKVTHKLWEQAMLTYKNYGAKTLEGLGEQEQWESGLHTCMKAEWIRLGFEESKDDLRKLTALSHRAAWWWRQPLPFDNILAVEELMEAELPDGTVLFGKLDAVCERDGKIRHHQLKTYGGNTPGLKMKLIKRSLHEGGYWLLGEAQHGEAWTGTHLTLLRSLPLRRKVDGKLEMRPNASMVMDEPLVITKALRDRAVRDITWAAQSMMVLRTLLDKKVKQPFDLPQHEQHCGGMFGSSECAFLEYCMRYTELSDTTMYEDANPLEHYEEVAG